MVQNEYHRGQPIPSLVTAEQDTIFVSTSRVMRTSSTIACATVGPGCRLRQATRAILS